MATITGFIEKIKFRNEDNGYTVLSVTDQSDGEEVIMVGKLAYAAEGDMIEASGVMTEHPVYGQQLQIETCQMKLPQDEQSVERYLGSGAIKGVGAALAARIVRRFKADTLRILEEEPERLAEVKGISEKMAMAIGEQIEEKKDMRQAMMFLQNYGISMNLAAKIYQEYGPALYGIYGLRLPHQGGASLYPSSGHRGRPYISAQGRTSLPDCPAFKSGTFRYGKTSHGYAD